MIKEDIGLNKKPPLKAAALQGRKAKNSTEILAEKGEKVNG